MFFITKKSPKTIKQLFVFGLLFSIFGFSLADTPLTVSTSTDYSFLNTAAFDKKQLENLSFETDCFFIHSPSYEKQLYSQSSNSLQSDTTKIKKTVMPNKGSVQPQEQKIATNEIDALMLDATFSPGGYDFYIDFSQNWAPPASASDYNILVKEYPGRGNIVVVAVEINGKQLVYRRLRPTYSAIHGLSVAVASYLYGYLARGDHLSGVDADGNFIDIQRADVTRQIKTPFDIY